MAVPVNSIPVRLEREVLQSKAVEETGRDDYGYPEDSDVSTGSHEESPSSRRTIPRGCSYPIESAEVLPAPRGEN